MSANYLKYTMAANNMLGRCAMSRRYGNFHRASLQWLAASRLFQLALKS